MLADNSYESRHLLKLKAPFKNISVQQGPILFIYLTSPDCVYAAFSSILLEF